MLFPAHCCRSHSYTVFMPTDDALKAAGLSAASIAKMSVSDAADLAKYHVVSTSSWTTGLLGLGGALLLWGWLQMLVANACVLQAGAGLLWPHAAATMCTIQRARHSSLQVDGYHPIPTGFPDGKPVDTLLVADGKPTTVAVTYKVWLMHASTSCSLRCSAWQSQNAYMPFCWQFAVQ